MTLRLLAVQHRMECRQARSGRWACHPYCEAIRYGSEAQQAVRYQQQRDVVTGVALGLCLMALGWVSLAAF